MKKNNKPARPSVDKKTAFRLLGYITRDYMPKFIVVLIAIVIATICSVSFTFFLQFLIDRHIMPMLAMGEHDFSGLARMVMVMAGVGIVEALCSAIYMRHMANISQGVQKTIRDDMFSRMQRLPISYFDRNTFGETMSHYTNDTDTLRQMLSQSLPQLFVAAVNIVFLLVAMFITNVPMTIFMLVLIFLMTNVGGFIAKKSGSYFAKQQESLGSINGYIEEMINGQRVIKVFCHEDATKNNFDQLNKKLCENATKANTFTSILMPVMMNLGTLLYVLVAIFGGVFAINGWGVTIGIIAAFLQFSKAFTNQIGQISQQANMVIMALVGAERIFKFMDEKPEVDDGYVTLVNAKIDGENITEVAAYTGLWAWKHPHSDGTTTYTRLSGEVRFYDVDFAYIEDKLVLKNVTLYAKSGQKLAFVGATGAGKTTITNLINRFYDIADGKIRYDGININKIKKADLRRSLGVVLQDTNLFSGTIMDNIKYGKLDASLEEVQSAARLAHADGFIERLPEGYDTEISGSSDSLSQGQRQLLSIARAAIANPPVMILDEATSSIDTHTEAIVQKAMDGLMEGRTVFVIAHRLSTIRNADAIMVLDLGEIIERGTHEQLIAHKGVYYQLYTGAFELQ